MNGYFTFEIQTKNKLTRTMVLFCATSTPSLNAVFDAIKKYVEDITSPDSILLLSLESEQDGIEKISKDNRITDTLHNFTTATDNRHVQVGYIPRNGLNDEDQIGNFSWGQLRSTGLATIFEKRKALMIAPHTHHFEKPSRHHSDKFIRTANALVDGAEITFIAACCLRFIPNSVRHIYCDTGGINVIAFAIDSLRRRFDNKVHAATVDTFESYEGLPNLSIQHVTESIVLVSASTTGGLEKRICEQIKDIKPQQIITIFSVDHSKIDAKALLVLKESELLADYFTDITSFESDSCPLCRSGSIPVPMMGDQFIPVKATTKAVNPGTKHKPPWLDRVLPSMAGRDILRAFYRSPNSPHATNDVFIDLERAMIESWDTYFLKRLERSIKQNLPACVRRIIHLDDSASKLLAEKVIELLPKEEWSPDIEVFSSRDLKNAIHINDGACLVIASAVATGHSLLAISQSLRNLQRNKAISYIVALTRYDLESRRKYIESDITMGDAPNDYSFSAAERVFLPITGKDAESSWDEELPLLESWANTAQDPLKELLEKRIDILRQAQNNNERGLATNLFWSKCSGEDMVVRPGFVYLPKEKDMNFSQGDVYFTVVSVLHHMRTNGLKPELRQTEFERCVLSPDCFERFNDGVIQASFLRGSIRPELNFASSRKESKRMSEIIRSILRCSCTETGEASREFVLAIALRRLVLHKDDLTNLYNEFKSDRNDAIAHRMWEHVFKTLIRPEQQFD